MKPIPVVFENGVFRPIESVDLPEGFEARVEAGLTPDRQPEPTDSEFAHLDAGLRPIYAILSHRYDGGRSDGAARHDEHQP